jgi:mevalonate kinase
MPVIVGKAPGKIILFGEHAVVYGQPAIAIPVSGVRATAHAAPIFDSPHGNIHIYAPDIDLNTTLTQLSPDHPIKKAVDLTLDSFHLDHIPAFSLQVTSTIPVSAGLGSGAAISVAIIKAVSGFLGKKVSVSELSDLVFEVEKIHHGTPSGIDNTVIAYQKPIFYIRDNPIQFLEINQPTHWIIADTGEKTPTLETVSAVRNLHTADPVKYDDIFQKIGQIAVDAREPLKKGDIVTLGLLMKENQRLLSQLNVSCSSLDTLIQAANSAGAEGAKLSGGGKGGNIIALSSADRSAAIEDALIQAGAVRIIKTILSGHGAA